MADRASAKRIIIVFQFTRHPFHGTCNIVALGERSQARQPYSLVISRYDDAVLNDYEAPVCYGNSGIFPVPSRRGILTKNKPLSASARPHFIDVITLYNNDTRRG